MTINPRKAKKLKAFADRYREHIGHVVLLTDGVTGKLERVSLEIDGSVWCWVNDGEQFPRRCDPMELKDCECYQTKTP